MSNTLTIPKSFVKNDDLVVMPRHEYERLISVQRFKEFTPTIADKKALARARLHLKQGRTLSYDESIPEGPTFGSDQHRVLTTWLLDSQGKTTSPPAPPRRGGVFHIRTPSLGGGRGRFDPDSGGATIGV